MIIVDDTELQATLNILHETHYLGHTERNRLVNRHILGASCNLHDIDKKIVDGAN